MFLYSMESLIPFYAIDLYILFYIIEVCLCLWVVRSGGRGLRFESWRVRHINQGLSLAARPFFVPGDQVVTMVWPLVFTTRINPVSFDLCFLKGALEQVRTIFKTRCMFVSFWRSIVVFNPRLIKVLQSFWNSHIFIFSKVTLYLFTNEYYGLLMFFCKITT